MDSQGSPDEPQANRKIPIESLSKEDLIKKYRQAIIIAQKAKESKAELIKQYAEHEQIVQSLQESLQKSEDEKIKEADLRAHLEHELKDTKNIIDAMRMNRVINEDKEETETNESELKSKMEKCHLERSKCLAELELSTEKISSLQSELLQAKFDSQRLTDSYDQVQKLIDAKDHELICFKEALAKEKELNESNQVDFESKLKFLEDSLSCEKKRNIEDNLESEKKILCLTELLLSKEGDIKKQEECIAKVNMHVEEIQKQLCDNECILNNYDSKIIELEKQVESYRNAVNEKASETERDNANKITMDQMREEISRKGKEYSMAETTILELSSELQVTKETLVNLKQQSSELCSKLNSLELENSTLSEKIASLEREQAYLPDDKLDESKNQKILKLETQVEELQKEASVKENLLKSAEEKRCLLESQIKLLTSEVENNTSTSHNIEILTEENNKLQNDVHERDKAVQKQCVEMTNLSSQVSELDNELRMVSNENSGAIRVINEMKDQLKKSEEKLQIFEAEQLSSEQIKQEMREQVMSLQSTLSGKDKLIQDLEQAVSKLIKEKDLLKNKFHEREEAIKIISIDRSTQVSYQEDELDAGSDEKSDGICMIDRMKERLRECEEKIKNFDAELLSGIQIEQEFREQVASLQATLSGKDKLIQDLEQEVSKLRDVAANESTNTEVSSTFSLSRAEEMSRMKDLEDSFEDKYTKLRVVAVKLKKRVTELTQTLEMERAKMATEKLDLQAKLSQLASNAKTVQTLQNEVDRLQDLVEEQKKQQQQLTKDLELAVKESASKKFELASVQEELLLTANEKKNLEISLSSLESTLSQTGGLQSKIEELQKKLKEKDDLLESLKEEKQLLSEQLEKVCADAKKKSVLSLEMADMEKSVSELTRQLSSERDRLKSSENEVEQGRLSLSSLQDKLNKIENSLVEKEIENKKLHKQVSLIKEESENFQSKLKEKEAIAAQVSNDLEKQRSLVEELNIQCSNLAAKQVQVEEHARHQIDSLSRQVFQLEEHSSAMKGSYKNLEDELVSVKTEFENYKVRAQSVLRQSTKQEDRMISSSTFHNAEELEVEVERLRVNVSNLQENLKQTNSQLQAALQDVGIEREEKTCALKQAQTSKELYNQATERHRAAEERLSAVLEESKQAKLNSDMLLQCYKQQLDDLKTTHQKKISSLTEQLENLQASITNPVLPPVESDQASSVQSGPSPVAEWAVNLSNTAISDPDLAMRLSSLQREEGEGSESVESFPSRRISVSTQERRHELVPLDKLLSSSSYPEDDSPEIARANSSDLDADLLQSKLCACESRAAHLTALLSEAESDAARLSQLNAVLKEEIRRQQRSEERAQHAHNLEYLKNIVVKFITLQNGDERQRLVPVLNTILKLSPEEAKLVATVAKGASQSNASGRGWGNYLPLPGWTGTGS